MESEGAAVTCDGRLFHRRAAAMGSVLSPTVDRRVRRTSRDVDEVERSRRLSWGSAGRRSSSHRYVSARPFWHFYAKTATLQLIRKRPSDFSHWSRLSSGLMWSNLDDENIRLAAAFITDWSRWRNGLM